MRYLTFCSRASEVHNKRLMGPLCWGWCMVFVMWIVHTCRNRTDTVNWSLRAAVSSARAPAAKKSNAGQKADSSGRDHSGHSISVSGIFAAFVRADHVRTTLALLNDMGVPATLGLRHSGCNAGPARGNGNTPNCRHAVIKLSFLHRLGIIALSIIGTLGMEGCVRSNGSGDVGTLNGHREHHAFWADEVVAKQGNLPWGTQGRQAVI